MQGLIVYCNALPAQAGLWVKMSDGKMLCITKKTSELRGNLLVRRKSKKIHKMREKR
jgi:hypothetical protein